MIHSFDVDIATEHGVECAIMLANIEFWVAKNKANRKHFHKGRYWTYNSIKAWAELFPYWSSDKVRRVLERLEERGLVVSDNFNSSGYDRTKWYTLSCDSCQIDLANLPNGSGESAKSLIRTDSKPDTKSATKDRATSGDSEQYEETFIEFWKNWPTNKRKGSKPQCGAFWKRKKLHLKTKQILEHVNLMKNSHDWTKDNGQYMPAPLTYLHQMRWEGAEPTQDQKENKWAGAI